MEDKLKMWGAQLGVPEIILTNLEKSWLEARWFGSEEVDINSMSLMDLLGFLQSKRIISADKALTIQSAASRRGFDAKKKLPSALGNVRITQINDARGASQTVEIDGEVVARGSAQSAAAAIVSRRLGAQLVLPPEEIEEEEDPDEDDPDEENGEVMEEEVEEEPERDPRTTRPTVAPTAKPKRFNFVGTMENLGKKLLPKGWPAFLYVAIPSAILIFVAALLLALIGGLIWGAVDSAVSGTDAPFYGATTPVPTSVTPTELPNGATPEPWFNKQLASEQGSGVKFDFLKHWDINQIADWVTKTPWQFIAFLFLGPFIIGLMTFQERNAEQESSDVWLIMSGQGAYIVLFVAAELWSWFGWQYGVDVGTGPAWVHVIAFIVNFSLQFAASFGGDKDWTAVAGHGLFIPGVAMVAWWWNDLLLSGIGIALMLAGLVWECAEVNNSGGNQDKKGGRGGLGALIAAVVMVVVFLATTALLYFTFGGLPYIPAPDWKVDPALLKIYAASLAWVFNNRVIVAATFGAIISWGSGVALATALITNLKTGIGPEGKMRVGESSRHDAVVVGVMLTYFVVLMLSFLF